VKCFYNTKKAIPYIQDIEIINVFRDGVSDIKTVEEIAMKKPKMVANLLAVVDTCIEASEARARLFESHARGPKRRSMTIMASSTLIKKKRGLSVILTTQRSDVRSIVPQGTIWKSVKLFWIKRRCRHQQRRHH
jgi:hypothetical protein